MREIAACWPSLAEFGAADQATISCGSRPKDGLYKKTPRSSPPGSDLPPELWSWSEEISEHPLRIGYRHTQGQLHPVIAAADARLTRFLQDLTVA